MARLKNKRIAKVPDTLTDTLDDMAAALTAAQSALPDSEPARPAAKPREFDLDRAALSEDPDEAPFDLSKLDLPTLLRLRHEIEAHLPPRTLGEVDLIEELLLQYQSGKFLMNSVMASAAVPANQKAQVLSACANVLEQVSKTQTALYNAERVKALEQALERTLAGVSQELRERFFALYQETLREFAAAKPPPKRV